MPVSEIQPKIDSNSQLETKSESRISIERKIKEDFYELGRYLIDNKRYLNELEEDEEFKNKVQKAFNNDDLTFEQRENLITLLTRRIYQDFTKDGFNLEYFKSKNIQEESGKGLIREILKLSVENDSTLICNNFENISSENREYFIDSFISELRDLNKELENTEINSEQKLQIIKKFKKYERNLLKVAKDIGSSSIQNLNIEIGKLYQQINLSSEIFRRSALKAKDSEKLVYDYDIRFDRNSNNTESSRRRYLKKLVNQEAMSKEDQEKLYNDFLQRDPKLIISIINSKPEILNFKARDEIIVDLIKILKDTNPKLIIENFKTFELMLSSGRSGLNINQLIVLLRDTNNTEYLIKYLKKLPNDYREQASASITNARLGTTTEISPTKENKANILKLFNEKDYDSKKYFFLLYNRLIDTENSQGFIEELISKNEFHYFAELLLTQPNIDKDQEDRILEIVLNSNFVYKLEPIISRYPKAIQERYNNIRLNTYIADLSKEELKDAYRATVEKAEAATDDPRDGEAKKIKFVKVLKGFMSTINRESNTEVLRGQGLDDRVVSHLEIRAKEGLERTKHRMLLLQKWAEELGDLTILETIAFLQGQIDQIYERAGVYHATTPLNLIEMLSDTSGRLKNAAEMKRDRARGISNAEVAKEHFGEAYQNIEEIPYLIFGYLSLDENGKERSTAGYGPVRIKFNKDRVKNRTTTYLGDSSGASFWRYTPQLLSNPHVSGILDTIRYGDKIPSLEEFKLDGNFFSDSIAVGQGQGNAFVEAQIHNHVFMEDIEEIIMSERELKLGGFSWRALSEIEFKEFKQKIEELVSKINRERNSSIKIRWV